MANEYLQSLFAMAHTDISILPLNNHGRTLRITVEANIDAYALSVQFSNLLGEATLPIGAASLALCDEQGTLVPDTLVPLTVGGVLGFELPAGQDMLSDTVRFPLKTGEFFALNIYYPTSEAVNSGNWISNYVQRSKPGNYSADPQLQAPGLVSRLARTIVPSDITVAATTVCEITAFCAVPSRVVACFGDSITQQGNWTVPFTKRLYHEYPGQISLCNLGISGNRLLADSPPSAGGYSGHAGIRRFARDVLDLHGLTHVILALGTNDIGLPGSHGLPDSDVITTQQYVDAMTFMADRLHEKGVKVYAATLIPRPLVRPYTVEREAIRFEMNAWIRTAACFDAVLDFDKVLRRGDAKPGMKDGCALPDGLHPTAYGGLLLAKSIPLSLFGGEADA